MYQFNYWTMDFITGLPFDKSCNAIYNCVDKLTKLINIIPCVVRERGLLASTTAKILFDHVFFSYGMP